MSPSMLAKAFGTFASLARTSPSFRTCASARFASTAVQYKDVPVSTPSAPSAVSDGDAPSFSTLEGKVSDGTLRAITGRPLNFLKTMSAVQAVIFPRLPGLSDPYSPSTRKDGSPRDLLVKAKTGTGKTLGFLVPAVEARLKNLQVMRAKAMREAGAEDDARFGDKAERQYAHSAVGTLIISPTRELATQIANEALKLTTYHRGFEVRLFVGGVSKGLQMRGWKNGRRDIVVATPGRLLDLIKSEPDVLKGISQTKQLILDEADTLLDMGFRDDIETIINYLPTTPERQTMLFSATVPKAVQQIARNTLDKDHEFINCVSVDDSPVHSHVEQYHTVVEDPAEQIPHVLRLLAHDQLTKPGRSKTIVFLPTTRQVMLFATQLRELARDTLPAGRNTVVYEIHSKRDMKARTNTSDRFRKDTSGASILVTSDVSARGVDYPGVTRVIQVGIPSSGEQYIHRVGRTGRGGSTEGRGDIVLLPWEQTFTKYNLADVPIRALSVAELKSQVSALAEEHDADPAAFQGRANAPVRYRAPYARSLEEVDRAVEELVGRLDAEAVRETMMSMLGFFCGQAGALRIPAQAIVDGIKEWSVRAAGLSTPPYLSAEFLKRLGLAPGGRGDRKRRTSSSSSPRSSFGMSRPARGDRPSWADRDSGYRPRRDRDGHDDQPRRERREWRDNHDEQPRREWRDNHDEQPRRERREWRDSHDDQPRRERREWRGEREGRPGRNTEAWKKTFGISSE